MSKMTKLSSARWKAPRSSSLLARRDLRIKAERVDSVGNDDDIGAPKKLSYLPGNQMRNRDQANTRITVDPALQKHDQLVVQPTMDEPRPGSERHATETQAASRVCSVERVKYDLDHGHDRHRGNWYPECRRGLGGTRPKRSVPPAPPVVGQEPPDEFQQMRPRNVRNSVPVDAWQSVSVERSTGRSPLICETCWAYRSMHQSFCRTNRSICSTMHISVPCCLSKNGDTTARRNSGLPCRGLGLGKFKCLWEQFQAIEHTEQEPKICVQQKILIRTIAGEHHRDK